MNGKLRMKFEWDRLLDNEPKWRCGRLRDVVAAREVLIQINSIFKKGCDERGVDSLQSLFPSVTDARNAFDSMPSFDSSVTLKTSPPQECQASLDTKRRARHPCPVINATLL